jgi:hypothetical protein
VNYDDETLMAYADGELDERQSAEISAAIEADPALARRVEQHRAMRAEVAGAFATVLDQPLPDRLVESAHGPAGSPADGTRSGKVLQFPARSARASATPWRAREWWAMAASVVLGAMISWKLFAPGESALVTASNGALVASGALAEALDRQLASTQRGVEPVLIGLTFRARDGNFCRSFALRGADTAGLACRVDGQWLIPVTAAAPASGGGVRQAASPPPAVLTAIEARISGEALDASGEENARLGGWRAAPPPR